VLSIISLLHLGVAHLRNAELLGSSPAVSAEVIKEICEAGAAGQSDGGAITARVIGQRAARIEWHAVSNTEVSDIGTDLKAVVAVSDGERLLILIHGMVAVLWEAKRQSAKIHA